MKSIIAFVTGAGMLVAAVFTPTSSMSGRAVNCNDGIWTYNGKFITAVSSKVEGIVPVNAVNPAACCNACQKEPGCAYSQWDNSGCNLALVGGSCSSTTVVGKFYTGTLASAGPLTISNGPCGQLNYGGNAPQTKRSTDSNSACSGLSEYYGKPINLVKSDVEGSFSNSANTASDCCEACSSEPGCAYSQFDANGCSLALVGGTCSSSTVVGSFYTGTSSGPAITIANGTCGELVYGGDDRS